MCTLFETGDRNGAVEYGTWTRMRVGWIHRPLPHLRRPPGSSWAWVMPLVLAIGDPRHRTGGHPSGIGSHPCRRRQLDAHPPRWFGFPPQRRRNRRCHCHLQSTAFSPVLCLTPSAWGARQIQRHHRWPHAPRRRAIASRRSCWLNLLPLELANEICNILMSLIYLG